MKYTQKGCLDVTYYKYSGIVKEIIYWWDATDGHDIKSQIEVKGAEGRFEWKRNIIFI